MTNNEAELRQKILECLVDFGNAVQGDPYYSITASDIDKEELDEIMHLITEQTRKARIEGGKDVFECFRDLWKNPPSGLDYHPEDAHWHANELYDMLDDLEADWLNQPHHKAEE